LPSEFDANKLVIEIALIASVVVAL